MDEKGQGSLEYLLIIAGALLVAAIVTFLLFSTASPATNRLGETQQKFFNRIDKTLNQA